MSERDSVLNYGPKRTTKALCRIFSGKDTLEKLAEDLELSEGTIYNIISDLRSLGFIDTNSREIEILDEQKVAKICQIDDLDPLKSSFKSLSYFRSINEIPEQGKTVEEIGNEVAFHSTSKATSEGVKKGYGAKVAKWGDFLNIVAYDPNNMVVYPPEKEVKGLVGGSKTLNAYPKNVMGVLSSIGSGKRSKEELKNELGLSGSSVDRAISTAYSLDLVEKIDGKYKLSDQGRNFRTKSEGRKKQYVREIILEFPIVRAILFYLPEEGIKCVERISKEYNRGWSDSYCSSIWKKHMKWMKYSGCLEKDGGYHVTEKLEEYDITRPDKI